jgi:sorting nexin-8
VRDLFARHDRLAHDSVDKLRKRVDSQSLKLESIKAAAKEGWEVEADKLIHAIERDQAAIQQALARRVFIRWCMWHEFRVVLHNRENTLLALLVQAWTVEERDYSEAVQSDLECARRECTEYAA